MNGPGPIYVYISVRAGLSVRTVKKRAGRVDTTRPLYIVLYVHIYVQIEVRLESTGGSNK